MQILSHIFVMIAAMFNAAMDRVENENFDQSIFRNMNKNFWYKRESWKSAKKYFGWKLDAWHIFKSAMIICLSIAFWLVCDNLGWLRIAFLGAEWILTFNLFYNHLFKK